MHPLVKKLREYDPRGTVTVGWVLSELERAEAAGVGSMGDAVPTTVAAEIMGLTHEGMADDKRASALRRLRRMAARWEAMQRAGRRPEVRVCRRGAAERSDWLFDRDDCYAYRRARGAVRIVGNDAPVEGTDDASEAEAIAEAIFRKHFV